MVAGEDETAAVAGSGSHCSVVGSGVPAALGVAAEAATNTYAGGIAIDGADEPATRLAPTHRARAKPKPTRIDTRRANGPVRLVMTPSFSLTTLL